MNKYFNDGHINPAIQEYTIEYRYDGAPLHTIKYIDDGGLELCYEKKSSSFEIKKVIFNDPATIVLWADGTKTVVKCGEEDIYDPQTGLLMCIAKKAFGNTGKFNDILREWVPEPDTIYMCNVIDQILGDASKVIGQYVFGEGEANA